MGKKSGFTLIELLVVVIIVAVLAAVGIPLLRDSIVQARASEAAAGLGAVRTTLRTEFARLGAYTVRAAGTAVMGADIGVTANDLNGHYFEDDDYTILSTANTYCITVTGDTAGAAPQGAEVNNLSRSMNDAGSLFANNNCTAPAIN